MMIRLLNNEKMKISKIKKYIIKALLTLAIIIIVYYNRNEKAISIYKTIYYLIPFVGLLCLLLYGDIFSNEYQNETLKIYLTKSYGRNKIFFSKIIYMFISILLMITYIIFCYLITIILLNKVDFNVVEEVFRTYVNSLPIFFICSLCVFISIISGSSTLSLTISLGLYLLSSIIFQILIGLNITIFEYSFLPYLDYTIFLDSNYIIELNNEFDINLSVMNGSLILLFNMIILIIISCGIFNKKDI